MDPADGVQSVPELLLVTGVLGGGAAWLAGRVIARTWRAWWQALGYMLILGTAIRFLHIALFGWDRFTLAAYLSDTLFVVVMGSVAWRVTRTTQMVRQYPWRYRRSSPLTWRAINGR